MSEGSSENIIEEEEGYLEPEVIIHESSTYYTPGTETTDLNNTGTEPEVIIHESSTDCTPEEKVFKCRHCDRVYSSHKSRYTHELQKHQIRIKQKSHAFLYCVRNGKIFPMHTQISKLASHVSKFVGYIVFKQINIAQTRETSRNTEGGSTCIPCYLCNPSFVTKTQLGKHCQENHPDSMTPFASIPEETRSGEQLETSQSGPRESKVIAEGIFDDLLDKMFAEVESQVQTSHQPVAKKKVHRCPASECKNRLFKEDAMLKHFREVHEMPPEAEAFVMKITVVPDVQSESEEVETSEIGIQTEDTEYSESVHSSQNPDTVDPRADEEEGYMVSNKYLLTFKE